MSDSNATSQASTSTGETALADEDYFRSGRLIRDPYPYWNALRDAGPVFREPNYGVFMVTGYDEVHEIYRDSANFSSVNSVIGPFGKFSVPLEGDDVSAVIDEHRSDLPFTDQLPSFDQPRHTEHRGLLMRLFTPLRLQENEEAMDQIADDLIDGFVGTGSCEFVDQFASPMALLVIADLLGVPDEDRSRFREQLAAPTTSGKAGVDHSPLEFLYDTFRGYIADRRAEPRDDVLTRIATATFSDGSVPEIDDVMLLASNLFAAGQETTVRLLTYALQHLAENPELQSSLRADPTGVPAFIEEALRFESPIKGDFRLARRAAVIGGVTIPAGSTVMLLNGAANRDERKFECPHEFRPDRSDAREHVAFGHGIHFCIGSALARAEGRITVESMLRRLDDITISEEHHGPAGERKFRYVPTYMLRGLTALHLNFTAP